MRSIDEERQYIMILYLVWMISYWVLITDACNKLSTGRLRATWSLGLLLYVSIFKIVTPFFYYLLFCVEKRFNPFPFLLDCSCNYASFVSGSLLMCECSPFLINIKCGIYSCHICAKKQLGWLSSIAPGV